MAKNDLVVRLQGDSKSLEKALQSAKKGINDFGKESSKIEDVQKQFDKITSSSAPLGKKISDIRKEMVKLSAAGQTNTKVFKEMAQAAAGYKKQLDAVDSEIKTAMNSGKSMTAQFSDAKKALLDKTGLGGFAELLSNPYILAGTAITAAGKALYDYNVELERSLDRTAQFTGLSGNELNSLRNGIKSVADTFGKDFDTILSSVDGMMSQFGMDGETALNIIRDGFVSGADDGGKMLDLISQYSGSFKDAGVSASEMVAIIGNTRSGIFSPEGMELIKEGAKNIRMMSDTTIAALDEIGISGVDMATKLANGSMSTMEAIQQISTKLKDIPPQSKVAGDVLQAVFAEKGSSAGMELVTALADVNVHLDEVKKQSGEWGEAMLKVQEADRNLENALQTMFGVANGGFAEMGDILKGEIYQALANVINYFIKLYNESTAVRFGVAAIANTFKNAWVIIKSILKLFGNALVGIAELIEGVLTLDYKKVISSWENGFKGIFDTIKDGFEEIADNAKDMANQVINGKIEVVQTVEGSGETTTPISTNNNGKKYIGNVGASKNKNKKQKDKKETKKPAAGSIKALEEFLSKLNDELNTTVVSDERLAQIIEEKKQIEAQIKALKIRNGLEKADVKNVLDEKRKKFTDANNSINQTKSDYANGLITREEAQAAIDKTNATLQELGLKPLELHINNDGTITTAMEELEAYINKLNETSATIGTIGGAFTGLGSAIGGTGGKMMEFAGQTMQAAAQVIPQIIKMITAKQSEAMASGTASAASLPFPANLAAMASVIATVVSLFASIPKAFAEGGVVGGNSLHGDRLLARVNSNEVILNHSQAANLYRTLKNGNYGNNTMGGNVSFEISGTTLKGVLNNYDNKHKRLK